jgi:beta-glucosidase
MTLNEMGCFVFLGHQLGIHAPGAKEPPAVMNQIQHHALLAHGHGVRAVREHGGRGARVGQAYNPMVSLPVYETAEHIEAAAKYFADNNGPQAESMQRGTYPAKWLAKIGADAPKVEPGDMELISSPTDFVGLNIYLGVYVRAADNADGYQVIDFPPSYPKAYADWIKITPQALYWGTRFLHDLYGYREFYITENGCAMNDQLANGEVLDTDRVFYYREYLKGAARAVAEKYPLKGYFAWSLLDNFEWAYGYTHRFGLHYVDFQTQQRTPKLSAKYYAACIKARQVL